MRWLWITLGTAAGLAVLFFGLVFGLSETGGEVVVLQTLDAAGAPHETRLWVVDDDGNAWLRAGMPTSSWFLRLEANPHVQLTRGATTGPYLAEPVHDPAVRDRIHALMADKYGFAETFIAASRDGSFSIPVRLVPIPSP